MPFFANPLKCLRSDAAWRRSRIYLFTVTCLAVFLLGLIATQAVPAWSFAPAAAAPSGDGATDQASAHAAAEYEAARLALEAARADAQAAHRALDGFIMERMQETAQRLHDVAARQASTAVATLPQVPNPQWKEVMLKLRETAARRQILSTRLTDQHPELIQLDQQIADLQTELAKTPEVKPLLEEDPATAGEFAKQRLATVRQADADIQREQADQDAKQALLAQAVAAAEGLAEQRSQTERNFWQQLQVFNNQRLTTEQATQMTQQQSGAFQITTLALLGSLAITLAGIVVWLATPRNEWFTSVEQAQAELPVPIVGIVSRPLSRQKKATVAPAIVRWVQSGSELTLAAAVVAFLVAAFVDANFLAQFSSDPYHCLEQTVARVVWAQRG
jgi:hypothetical protein